ncbi:hypothetical protein QJS04_geneDACA001353 [Acorus gramineus]|uniref:Uncharacterized protein n=1 Tax=Acorus gramineus TaxID=55184 RepID=A0AAV9ADU9_ACOGR|nr:hypothetical protein QJS04_geneDACA001353 [Acorus gramineus]
MAKFSNNRSNSMPTRAHPLILEIEEELSKLKSPISSPTSSAILAGLNGLKGVYDRVDGLLRLPHTQKALLPHRKDKWVEEMLDGFIRLLDASNAARDALLTMKERVRDLESALRRRRAGGEACIESKIGAFVLSRKKAKKAINKCLVAVKQIRSSYPVQDGENNFLNVVVRLLSEVRDVTISIFHSIMLFVESASSKTKTSKWLLVSKALRKSAVACEEDQEMKSEVEVVDLSLYNLCNHKSCKDILGDDERLLVAQKQLEALDMSVEGLDSGLESVFRHLIQTRVTLLNIFSL